MDWFTTNKINGKILRIKYDKQLKNDNQKNNHQTVGVVPALPNNSVLKVNAHLNDGNSPELIEGNLFAGIKRNSLISDIIKKAAKNSKKELDIDLFNGLEDWNSDVNEGEYYRILSDALEGYSIYFLTLKRANAEEYKFQFDSLYFLSNNARKLRNVNDFDGIYISRNRDDELDRVWQELNDWYNGLRYMLCVKNHKSKDEWQIVGYLPKSFVQSQAFNKLDIKQVMDALKNAYDYNADVAKELQDQDDLNPQNWKEIDPDELL